MAASRKSTKKPNKKKKQEFSLLRFGIKWLVIFGVWVFIAAFFMVVYYAFDLPDIDKLYEKTKIPRVTLISSDGEEISYFGNLYGKYVDYEEFPKNLVDAVLSTEDRRFFDHFGIDVIGLFRAFGVNLAAGRVVQGGSTITQQLAKVTFLTHDRTIKRKVQEMIIALYLENKFSKEEIFTIYMNRIYFGAGNYGVSAAARSYFDKDVKDLNLFESAMIAGLIRAPSRYSPTNNMQLALERTDQVLKNMVDYGAITTYDILNQKKGLEDKIKLARSRQGSYFADWIREQLSDYVGVVDKDLVVITTLDTKLQDIAQRVLEGYLTRAEPERNITQGAVVIMRPNGEVLAMVGGKDYRTSQFNRAVQALRQPGSSFKLFIYLAAFANGFYPDYIMEDKPLKYGKWEPKNWDNKFIGEVTLRDAFANSINSVAVQLADELGINSVVNTAKRLGVTSELSHNLSSALGSSEVSLLELTAAYATVANDGNAVWIKGIKEINTAADDEVLYRQKSNPNHKVLNNVQLSYIKDLLKSVVSYGTGTKAAQSFDVAGKTGTSSDSRDAWFIGFSSEYVIGVWLGNDDNSPMVKVGGGSMPAAIWHDIMKQAMADVTPGSIDSELNWYQQGYQKSVWDGFFGSKGEEQKEKKDEKPAIEYEYPNSNR